MAMHSLVVVLLGQLARVSEVQCEGFLCWVSVLYCFPCLVKVDCGVAWGHLGHLQVVQVVEHRIVVDVVVGVLAFEPTYMVAID
jgi:hypothetical protein